MLLLSLLLLFTPAFALALSNPSLVISAPPNIPALPPSTRAILSTKNTTLTARVTRRNTFSFASIPTPPSSSSSTSQSKAKTEYLLDIPCRDYDFASYGVDVYGDGAVEVYRVGRGGVEIAGQGERVKVVEGQPVEVRVLRTREFYDARVGCKYDSFRGLRMGQGNMVSRVDGNGRIRQEDDAAIERRSGAGGAELVF